MKPIFNYRIYDFKKNNYEVESIIYDSSMSKTCLLFKKSFYDSNKTLINVIDDLKNINIAEKLLNEFGPDIDLEYTINNINKNLDLNYFLDLKYSLIKDLIPEKFSMDIEYQIFNYYIFKYTYNNISLIIEYDFDYPDSFSKRLKINHNNMLIEFNVFNHNEEFIFEKLLSLTLENDKLRFKNLFSKKKGFN